MNLEAFRPQEICYWRMISIPFSSMRSKGLPFCCLVIVREYCKYMIRIFISKGKPGRWLINRLNVNEN